MSQALEFGWGSISKLPQILSERDLRCPLFVTGERSFTQCGAADRIRDLSEHVANRFVCVGTMPEAGIVRSALEAALSRRIDSIIAIGGGLVLDVAKLVGIMAANKIGDPSRISSSNLGPSLPVIAIPTTAGSGSEATQFAVLYVGGQKQSVSHPSMRPEVAVVDPQLTETLPPSITATSGYDAIAQAIESFWAVQATEESRAYSESSLSLSLPAYLEAVRRPTPEHRIAMSRAAYLSGQAINISRTTAPHALSYTLTSQYGVPHGEAVSMTLPDFLVYNGLVTEQSIQGNMSVDSFRATYARLLRILGSSDAEHGRALLRNLARDAGLRTRLSDISPNVTALTHALWAGVNEERLSNNPRRLLLTDLEMMIAGRGL